MGTNAGILLIGPSGTNFNEILSGILTFSFKKIGLNVSSAKWLPFCLGLKVLMVQQKKNLVIGHTIWTNPHFYYYGLARDQTWAFPCKNNQAQPMTLNTLAIQTKWPFYDHCISLTIYILNHLRKKYHTFILYDSSILKHHRLLRLIHSQWR